jgi:hypothetical protein
MYKDHEFQDGFGDEARFPLWKDRKFTIHIRWQKNNPGEIQL